MSDFGWLELALLLNGGAIGGFTLAFLISGIIDVPYALLGFMCSLMLFYLSIQGDVYG